MSQSGQKKEPMIGLAADSNGPREPHENSRNSSRLTSSQCSSDESKDKPKTIFNLGPQTQERASFLQKQQTAFFSLSPRRKSNKHVACSNYNAQSKNPSTVQTSPPMEEQPTSSDRPGKALQNAQPSVNNSINQSDEPQNQSINAAGKTAFEPVQELDTTTAKQEMVVTLRCRPQSAIQSSANPKQTAINLKQLSEDNHVLQINKQRLTEAERDMEAHLIAKQELKEQTFGAMMARYKAENEHVVRNRNPSQKMQKRSRHQPANAEEQKFIPRPQSSNSLTGPLQQPKNLQKEPRELQTAMHDDGSDSKRALHQQTLQQFDNRRVAMKSTKTASFGMDGYNALSPQMQQLSTQEVCSPTITSAIQSPLKSMHRKRQESSPLVTDSVKLQKLDEDRDAKANSLMEESKNEKRMQSDYHFKQIASKKSSRGKESSSNFPLLLSKLTFQQVSNNSEDLIEQQDKFSSLNSSRRGALTPIQKTKDFKQKEHMISERSDQLSLQLPKAMTKTSSYTDTGKVSENRRRDGNSSRNKDERVSSKGHQEKNSSSFRMRSKTNDMTTIERGFLMSNQQDAAILEGGISANTSDAEPLFNSRSASYFILQSQLRDIQHDADSQSGYDRFLWPRSEHLEQNSQQEDGTPKTINTINSRMKAIQTKIQLSQKGGTNAATSSHNNRQTRGDGKHMSAAKSVNECKSQYSSAQVSDNNNNKASAGGLVQNGQEKRHQMKTMWSVAPGNEDAAIKQLQRKFSMQTDFPVRAKNGTDQINLQINTNVNFDKRMLARKELDSQFRDGLEQNNMLSAANTSKIISDSQYHQNRPPLGPNVAKKGVSIFWGGAGSKHSSLQKQQLRAQLQQSLSRTLTVSDQLLAQQQQALRQGGLGEAMQEHKQTYAKLRTQVGSQLQFRKGLQGRKVILDQVQPTALDEVISKSNLQSNLTMSNQIKQLSSNRSGISSNNNNAANKQYSSSQLATSSEKQQLQKKQQQKWQLKGFAPPQPITVKSAVGMPPPQQPAGSAVIKVTRAASGSPIYYPSSNNLSELETPCTPQKKVSRLQKSQTTQNSVDRRHNPVLQQVQQPQSRLQPMAPVAGQQKSLPHYNKIMSKSICDLSVGTAANQYEYSKNNPQHTATSQSSHKKLQSNSAAKTSNRIGLKINAVQIGNSLLSTSGKNSVTKRTKKQQQQLIVAGGLKNTDVSKTLSKAQNQSTISQISNRVQSANGYQKYLKNTLQTMSQMMATDQLSQQTVVADGAAVNEKLFHKSVRNNNNSISLKASKSMQLQKFAVMEQRSGSKSNIGLFYPSQSGSHVHLKHTLTMQPSKLIQGQHGAGGAATFDQERAEQVQVQLQDAKRQCNMLTDKNNKLQARIGYLTREVSDMNKLMEKFVLNNETDSNLKEQCVVKSYKSKLASVERKLEATMNKNAALKQENAVLKGNEQHFNMQIQQLIAEKDLLHNECVMMSQNIYIQKHERHQRQLLEDQMMPSSSAIEMLPNSSIINIETVPSQSRLHPESQHHSSLPLASPVTQLQLSAPQVPVIEETTADAEAQNDIQINPNDFAAAAEHNITTAIAQASIPDADLVRRRRESIEAEIRQHKLLERVQAIEEFNHMIKCDTCNLDANPTLFCDKARELYPTIDPIEYSLLRDDDTTEYVKQLLMRIVSETRSESRNLRLMLLQELKLKQALQDKVLELKISKQKLNERLKEIQAKAYVAGSHDAGVIECETDDLPEESKASPQRPQRQKAQTPAADRERGLEREAYNQKVKEIEMMKQQQFEKSKQTTAYLEQLRVQVVDQLDTIKEFKRELQRLYAPKVKIILQLITLQDEQKWRETSKDPRANVERAKKVLKDLFHLSEKVFDDSFFKTFMRSFEPIFNSEIAGMTQKIIDAIQKQQSRKSRKSTKDNKNRQDVAGFGKVIDDQISSFHRIVAIQDLRLKDAKLLQFARYLAHQTLGSEDKISIEIQSHEDNRMGNFLLQDCVKQLATQRSTQASDQIDEVHMNSLIGKLYDSQVLDVFFSHLKAPTEQQEDGQARQADASQGDKEQPEHATDSQQQTRVKNQMDVNEIVTAPTLVDCQTFRNLLHNFSNSTEEAKAAEQLLNILKVRTIGEQMVDLRQLMKIMTMVPEHTDSPQQLVDDL